MPTNSEKKVGTLTEYSRHTGMSRSTLYDLQTRGIVVMTEIEAGGTPLFGEAPKVSMVDFAATDEALRRRKGRRRLAVQPEADMPANGATATPLQSNNEMVDVALRRDRAMAERRELEVAQLRGTLMRADEVRSATVAILNAVRSGVLRLPDKVAHSVVAAGDYTEARELLTVECEAVLRGVSEELKRLAANVV